jgi:tetrapyrrole methylase family protein/MazG family protein
MSSPSRQVKETALSEHARTFEDLVAMMDRLRGPDGCPWDSEQTYETLRGYLLEECYEVVEALDASDRAALREELGDLLFQIVFLARLGKEEEAFTAADVVQGIADKMIRRHPHVFGTDRAETSEQVLRRWEEIKRAEKPSAPAEQHVGAVLSGVPRALPALLKAQRLSTKAARVGFDWPADPDVLDKVAEEVAELRGALDQGDRRQVAEELGDILFTLANLARRLGVDAEAALERANEKFRQRFCAVERELERRGIPIESAGLSTLDRIWEEVKAKER